MNSEETVEDTTPRVYVASLADYNNGDSLGRWFAFCDYDDAAKLLADIQAMLKTYDKLYPLPYGDKREEWAAHDFENLPKRLYSESMDFAAVYSWLEAVVEMSDERKEAYEAFLENGDDPEYFDDRYRGYYGGAHGYDDERVATDYAEEQWHENHDESEIPASLRSYIDWTSMGRDLMLSGDIWISAGHVFTSR